MTAPIDREPPTPTVMKKDTNTVLVIGSLAESLINFRGPLLSALHDHGLHVVGCAPGSPSHVIQKLRTLGVEYRPIRMDRAAINPWQDLKTLAKLYLICKELRPRIVVSYTIKPVIYGSLAARLAGVETIASMITGLGYAFSSGGIKRYLLNRVVQSMYAHVLRANRCVFFQNPDDMRLFQRLGLVRHEQAVLTNGSGIDIELFQPAPFPDRLRFLMMARLIRDKGVHDYAGAARIIKNAYPDVSFRLAGWFDENPACISRTDLDHWVAEGTIDYLGRLEDVRPAIRESSVYVLPSYYPEGTPRTVLEAMAMGRAIITTDMPGCRETVVDGHNGYLVPPRDPLALAQAMQRFITAPHLVQTMGQHSRSIAEQKYDVRKVNAVVLQAIGVARPQDNLTWPGEAVQDH
jgi:glycosyltransferase involved in cell wall biosynthesis